mgnify:FL=1
MFLFKLFWYENSIVNKILTINRVQLENVTC